jgi:hypothetical protein
VRVRGSAHRPSARAQFWLVASTSSQQPATRPPAASSLPSAISQEQPSSLREHCGPSGQRPARGEGRARGRPGPAGPTSHQPRTRHQGGPGPGHDYGLRTTDCRSTQQQQRQQRRAQSAERRGERSRAEQRGERRAERPGPQFAVCCLRAPARVLQLRTAQSLLWCFVLRLASCAMSPFPDSAALRAGAGQAKNWCFVFYEGCPVVRSGRPNKARNIEYWLIFKQHAPRSKAVLGAVCCVHAVHALKSLTS